MLKQAFVKASNDTRRYAERNAYEAVKQKPFFEFIVAVIKHQQHPDANQFFSDKKNMDMLVQAGVQSESAARVIFENLPSSLFTDQQIQRVFNAHHNSFTNWQAKPGYNQKIDFSQVATNDFQTTPAHKAAAQKEPDPTVIQNNFIKSFNEAKRDPEKFYDFAIDAATKFDNKNVKDFFIKNPNLLIEAALKNESAAKVIFRRIPAADLFTKAQIQQMRDQYPDKVNTWTLHKDYHASNIRSNAPVIREDNHKKYTDNKPTAFKSPSRFAKTLPKDSEPTKETESVTEDDNKPKLR